MGTERGKGRKREIDEEESLTLFISNSFALRHTSLFSTRVIIMEDRQRVERRERAEEASAVRCTI